MPDDNADLSTVTVTFPRLPDDSAAGCPVPVSDLLEYLAMEVPDGDSLSAEQLTFLRTADVEGTQYWIWRFREPDGDNAYATVSVAPGGSRTTIGYDADYYGLTPEQFILGDYHQVF
jgi:hypothetical protein